jgi:prepilin peptidase CpaA
MSVLTFLLVAIFPIAMAFAAANDLFTMRIPNVISLALISGFVGLAVLTRMPLETFGMHVVYALGVLLLTFALFAFHLLGGGDAKLMAAGALWMGSAQVLPFIAYTTLFGGILCLVILSYRRMVPAEAWPLPEWAQRLHMSGGPVPYGIAIAASGLTVFPATELFRMLPV